MLASLLRSARRYWSPRRPRPIRRPQHRLGFELLEDRVVPATSMTFGGLEFTTTGTLTDTNHAVTSSNPVQVGVAPAKGASFVPLLQLDDGVSFMDNDPSGTFTTTGTVSGIAGNDTLQLLDAQKHTFTGPGLLGSSYFTLAASDTNMAHLEVGGGELAVAALHLTASELDLQGTIDIAHVAGLTVAVQGSDHVVLNGDGVSLSGPDPTVTGPDTFTKDGVTLSVSNLDVHVDPTNNALDISGTGSVTIGGNTLSLTLGNTGAPGLVIQNGDIESLLATITPPKGDSSTQFKFGDLGLTLNSATFSFDQSAGTFGIGADATVMFDDHMVSLAIGSAGMPGIVINSSGQLASLDASVTTDLDIGDVTFKAEDLAVHYVPGADLSITGSMSFMFDNQSVELSLGSTDADGTMHPGIDIDPSTGNVISLDAAVSTDIEIGDVTIKADDLSIHYAPGDDFTITGTAEFDLKDDNATGKDPTDQMVSLMLGSDGHPGIDISPAGQLVSFDAAVTSDISVAGLHITTDGLGVEYQAGSLAIYGSASFMLMDNSVGIMLGSADAPGLVISNGQLQSLDASVTADIHVLGIDLSANGLTVAYTAPMGNSPEMIDIYGDVSVTTSFLNFDSMLGTASDPGIQIVGGQLTQLNISVTGGFSLFGFTVAANGLNIDYNQSMSSLELSGGVMVQFTSDIDLATSITKGGLLINTQTGALSIDATNGLSFGGSITFGNYGIKNLMVSFSNGPNGVNFSASGELDLPDNIKVVLDQLDIVDGQLADIGITLDAPIEIGDTGFFIDSISGDLQNLNNISQLQVMASVTLSEGPLIDVPSIPGIFGGGMFSLVQATGSITVSASQLDLSGQVTLLGGLLGSGQASIDLNWVTGVYSVTGSFSMYDGIITFSGSLMFDNYGDITLLATASVNVPDVIPIIGGDSLGNINFYLQYRPSHTPGQAPDWTQSYVAVWTNVNLFFFSFTIGFKIDFQGDFSLINGNDVNAITATADMNQPAANQPYTYSCSYDITDPNATSAEITLSSLDFFDDAYASGPYTAANVPSSGNSAAGNITTTYYQLNQGVILPSLSFDVMEFGSDIGQVTFDQAGNFKFTSTNVTTAVPDGGTVNSLGQVLLYWPNDYDPGTTAITNVSYDTSNAVIDVYQNLQGGGQQLVDTYTIDPQGQGTTSTSAEGALYVDTVDNPTFKVRGNTWNATYTLPHGDPDEKSMMFTVAVGGTMVAKCTVDPQNGSVTITPVSGTGSLPVPTSGTVQDNAIELSWNGNPGSATSVTATYRSVDDRVLSINLANSAKNGIPGQYTVELVTYQQLLNPPTFTETTEYKAPVVSFPAGQPSVVNGVLGGTIDAASYVPSAAQGGAQGSPSDSQISLYYTQDPGPVNGATNGTLFDTLDYGSFQGGGNGALESDLFSWDGFQNLPAGQYYIYAVINDGQNPLQYSALSGPFTATGPTPTLSAPTGLALTPNAAGTGQGTFSAAAGTALGVSLGFNAPITINATVTGGSLVFPPGSPVTQFPFTASASQAQKDLDGLQFVADDTFSNSTTLTLTATSDVNGTPYTATENVPLLTPNTHLVVTQSLYGPVNAVTVTNGGTGYQTAPTVTFTSSDGLGSGATGVATIQNGQVTGVTITNSGSGYDAPPIVTFSGGDPMTPATATATVLTPTDPDTSIDTVTVTNPGGPDDQAGTNVMIQEYLSKGVSIESYTASQGTFDPTTGLWNIGNLPISATNAVTLTLTLKADPSTDDQQLTSLAEGSSKLYNYPPTDASSEVAIVPKSHDVVFMPQTLASTAVNAPAEWQLTANGGGGGPYTYVLAPGSTLPPGLFLQKNGYLSGLPSTAGNYTFSVTATSAQGVMATAPIQLAVASDPIAIAGTAYSYTLGSADFQFYTVTPGSTLPPGLSINYDSNAGNYVLSGTPTTPGFYSFSVRADSDFFGLYQDFPMTMFVDAPITISPTSLPNAAIGTPYSQTITATGGSGGLIYGLYNGNVPAGLDVTPDGILSGTIASTVTPGTYTFGIYAYDASGTDSVQTYSLVVEPALVTSPASLPAATVASPYSVTLSATGGSGSGYTFAVTAGTLPAGLSLSPSGVFSGTIPAGTQALDTAITITTTDSNGTAAAQTYTLDVNPAIALAPSDLGNAAAGTDFTTTLNAVGGSGTGYTFALTGGTLPTGLTLAADGTLSGNIPSSAAAGYYAFTVTTTDSNGATGAMTCTLFVDAVMTVPTPKLPAATVGLPYSQPFTATGGSGIFTYAVTAGTLPAGLTLSPAGVLGGTVTNAALPGVYSFTVTATDSLGNTCTCPATLTVNAANVTWTGAVSTAWSNPANWSSHSVPGAGDNVTIPTIGRCPVLDIAATVNNLIVQPGSSLTLAGHALTVDGTVTNKGNIILQGNEAVTLAHGNDTAEGTWTYIGDGTGGTVTVANFGSTSYFNLTVNDSHPHHDTFATASPLNVAGNLTVACGTFAPAASVTTCGVSLSGTGILDAPAVLNDSGNWIVSGGTFNADSGTVFLTGTGTTTLVSGNKAFANLTHSGTGTGNLAGTPLTVNGTFTDAAGSGNVRTNNLAVTVAGPATLAGGAFTDGAGLVRFNDGLTLAGGSFLGSIGPVTAAGITMTAGSFTAPMSTLTDTGNWTITGGTFNADRGTVILAGTNQVVSGNTTFFTLEKTVTAADTLTFQAGSTQTIDGTLILHGASATKLLALRSSTTGSTWSIVPLGAVSVSFVDVEDSVNGGKKAITATHSHNSGDDTGWTFA